MNSSNSWMQNKTGCKNCGFAFCKDCLSKKAKVPKYGNEVHRVCNNCFTALSGGVAKLEDPSKYSPPEAYKKRVAALEHKNDGHKPEQTKPKTGKPHKHKELEKEDIAIAERLQKLKDERKKREGPVPGKDEIEKRLQGLKEDRPAPPSADDMAKRLAQLKGHDPDTVNKPHVFKKETRPEQQQIDDLLAEICDEVEIDSHGVDPAADVQERLDHLKGKDTSAPHRGGGGVNVPRVTSDYRSGSGEDIDINAMNRLMAQVAQEMEVDARKAIAGLEKDKELMDRLNQLKQERKAKQKKGAESGESEDTAEEKNSELSGKFAHLQPEFSDSEDEEEAIKRILKQSLAEAAIDDEVGASGYTMPGEDSARSGKPAATSVAKGKKKHKKNAEKPTTPRRKQESDEDYSESDEFPWCCICNEDATLKCIGCDYDLYCKRCFKEGHDRLDMEDHTCFPFKPKTPKQT